MPDPELTQLLSNFSAPPPPQAAAPPSEPPKYGGPFADLLNNFADPGGTARLAAARSAASDIEEGPDTAKFYERRSVPVLSTVGRIVEDQTYKRALAKIGSGDAGEGDFTAVARYERLKEIEAKRGPGGKLAGGLAQIPALAGEFALTGGAAGGAGRLAAAGAGRIGAAAGGQAVAGFAGRAAAQAALVPSMTAEQASQRSVQQGGEIYDPQNLAPAFAYSTAQAAVLGSIGRQVGGLKGSLAAKALVGGEAGVIEQQGVDIAAGLADKVLPDAYKTKTNFGTLGKFFDRQDDALSHFGVELATFAVMAGLHRQPAEPGAKPELPAESTRLMQTAAAAVDEGTARGASQQAVARELKETVHDRFMRYLQEDSSTAWDRAKDVYEEEMTGKKAAYAKAVAEAVLKPAADAAKAEPPKPVAPVAVEPQPSAPPPQPTVRERVDALATEWKSLNEARTALMPAAKADVGSARQADAAKQVAKLEGQMKRKAKELAAARDELHRQPSETPTPAAEAPKTPQEPPKPETASESQPGGERPVAGQGGPQPLPEHIQSAVDDMLKKVDAGSMPTFISKGLERVAGAVGVEIKGSDTARDVVEKIRAATRGKEAPPEGQPPGGVERRVAEGQSPTGSERRRAMLERIKAAGAKQAETNTTLADIVKDAGLEGRTSKTAPSNEFSHFLDYPGGEGLDTHLTLVPERNAVHVGFAFKGKLGGLVEHRAQMPRAEAVALIRDLEKIAGATARKGMAIEFKAEDKRAALYGRGLKRAGYALVSERPAGAEWMGLKDYRFELRDTSENVHAEGQLAGIPAAEVRGHVARAEAEGEAEGLAVARAAADAGRGPPAAAGQGGAGGPGAAAPGRPAEAGAGAAGGPPGPAEAAPGRPAVPAPAGGDAAAVAPSALPADRGRLMDLAAAGNAPAAERLAAEAGMTTKQAHAFRERLAGRTASEMRADPELAKEGGGKPTQQMVEKHVAAALKKLGESVEWMNAAAENQRLAAVERGGFRRKRGAEGVEDDGGEEAQPRQAPARTPQERKQDALEAQADLILAEAKKPKPGLSLRQAVVAHGRIDPNGGEFTKHYSGRKEAIEDGIHPKLFVGRAGGGRDLVELAKELEGNGKLNVPEGVDPGEYLLGQLKANAEAVDRTESSGYHDASLLAHYAKEQEIADAREEAIRSGASHRAAEEALRQGVAAGEAEGEDAGGRHHPAPPVPAGGPPAHGVRPAREPDNAAGPGAGDAGGFEFGANAPTAGGAAAGPEPAGGSGRGRVLAEGMGNTGTNLIGEPLPVKFKSKKKVQPTIEDAYRERDRGDEGSVAVGPQQSGFGRPLSPEERQQGTAGGGQPTAGEGTPARPPNETALANERVDAERVENGLPPLMAAARRANPQVWDAAMARLAADPRAADRLVDELAGRPRATTVDENAVLLHQKVVLRNEYERTQRQANEAMRPGPGKNPAEFDRLSGVADELLGQIDRLDRVTRSTGTEWGRAGQFRRQLAAEDFSLSSMLMRARRAKGRPLTPEERDRITALQAKLEAAEKRLAGAEAGTAPAAKPGGAGDMADVRIAAAKPKAEFADILAKLTRASKPLPQRVFGHVGEALNVSRAFITAYDLSAVLRQGGFLSYAHPVKAARAFLPSLHAFASERAFDRVQDEIAHRPNAGLYKAAKLYLADAAGPASAGEEAFMSRWARAIPGVRQSERAYTAYLNRMRADVFDSLAASLPRGRGPTVEEAKSLANFVNVATGRGNAGQFGGAMTALANVFFSPRYVLSRFQLLAGQPFVSGSAATRGLVAGEYARAAAGLALVYGVAAAFNRDAKISFDPRSADFGKVVLGNTRVDPLTGLGQVSVFGSRLAAGEFKSTQTGKVSPIRGPNVPYGGTTAGDVIGRFVRSKLAPVPGAAMDLATGKTAVGEPTNKTELPGGRKLAGTPAVAAREGGQLLLPISVRDVYDAFKDQGVPRNVGVALLAILGMGTQLYERPGKGG